MNNFEKTYLNIIFEEAKTNFLKKNVSVICNVKTKPDDPITKDVENAKIKELEKSNSTLGSLLQTIGKRMLGVGKVIEKREEKENKNSNNSNENNQTTEINASAAAEGENNSSEQSNIESTNTTDQSPENETT